MDGIPRRKSLSSTDRPTERRSEPEPEQEPSVRRSSSFPFASLLFACPGPWLSLVRSAFVRPSVCLWLSCRPRKKEDEEPSLFLACSFVRLPGPEQRLIHSLTRASRPKEILEAGEERASERANNRATSVYSLCAYCSERPARPRQPLLFCINTMSNEYEYPYRKEISRTHGGQFDE